MKYIKIFGIYSFALILSMMPAQKAKAVDLGPLSVTVGFCQQVDKIGSILNSFTIVQWPVGGFPGITMGMLSNTSVVMDFCAYITQLEQLDTTQAVFYTANYLNTLTGKKWDDHLQQADRTFNLANTIYDFENGTTRQGAFESRSTYQEMNDYIRDSYKWSNKTFNGRDAELKTRGEREADMNRLGNVAYQRSILKEMMNCPEPQSTDYSAVYKSTIDPQIKKRDDAQEDYMFFKEKLLMMGPKFLDNEDGMMKYVEEIESLENLGVTYDMNSAVVKMDTMKPDKKKKDAKGKPVQVKVTISRRYQTFKALTTDSVFNEFMTKYNDRWKGFIKQSIVANGSMGLLDDPSERVAADFRDLNYECNPRKLMNGFDDSKGTYDIEFDKRKKQCQENVKMDEKKAENLFSYYVKQMQVSLTAMKSANSIIWTTESKVMGRNRFITNDQKSEGGFQQEQVKCSETLTPAEMDKLSIKQQAVDNELNEMLVKEAKKQTMMEEEKMKQSAEFMKEHNIRQDQTQKKAEQRDKAREVSPAIVPPRGGIGKKGN